MVFGKHINRYYLKYALWLLGGLAALVMVDYLQLEIPKLYRMIIDGMAYGYITENGAQIPFTMDLVIDQICLPMVKIILAMVFGRFLWRICFFGSAVRLEEDLRNKMFDHAKDLSRQYYQVNKVGDLMSLFTNDLDTVQECFGWGIMMFFDALLLGVMAVIRMAEMDLLLTGLSLIPVRKNFKSFTGDRRFCYRNGFSADVFRNSIGICRICQNPGGPGSAGCRRSIRRRRDRCSCRHSDLCRRRRQILLCRILSARTASGCRSFPQPPQVSQSKRFLHPALFLHRFCRRNVYCRIKSGVPAA